jgi:hypothetical protein
MSYFARMAQRATGQPSSLLPRIPSFYEGTTPSEVESGSVQLAPPEEPTAPPPSAEIEVKAPTEPRPRTRDAEPRPVFSPKSAPSEEARPVESRATRASAPEEPPSKTAVEVRSQAARASEPRPVESRSVEGRPTEDRPTEPRGIEPRPPESFRPRAQQQPEAPAPRALAPESQVVVTAAAPTIRVHIGRVDVRAVFPAPPPVPRAAPASPSAMSLERFLQRGRSR